MTRAKHVWRSLPGGRMTRPLWLLAVLYLGVKLVMAVALDVRGEHADAWFTNMSVTPLIVLLAWIDLRDTIRRTAVSNVLSVVATTPRVTTTYHLSDDNPVQR